jgi:hypothetical protein
MKQTFDNIVLTDLELIDFQTFLKSGSLEDISEKILESLWGDTDMMRRDLLDKFLEYIYKRCMTGYVDIPSMAYPTKRMMDKELEERVKLLINEHLHPDIIFRILKFFLRNVHESDSNLYIAHLIESDEIINSILDTFRLLKKDIFKSNADERTLNVKRIQQFSKYSENKLSSPLDACARLKYVLEFFAIKKNVSHLYKREDILLYHMV